jgi:hypothetical protein
MALPPPVRPALAVFACAPIAWACASSDGGGALGSDAGPGADQGPGGDAGAEATGACTAPPLQGVEATAVSGRNVRLRWAPLPSGFTVAIERAKGSSGVYAKVATRAADHARHLDLALDPKTTYRYRLSACDATACCPPVETSEVTTRESHVPPLQITVPSNGALLDLALLPIVRSTDNVATQGTMAAIDRNGTVVWEHRTETLGEISEIEPLADHTLATGTNVFFTWVDLDGTLVYRNLYTTMHHDIGRMSDGRFVYASFDQFDSAPGYTVLGDAVEILDTTTNRVDWRWAARDHVPLADQNELDILLNFLGLGHDWTHANMVRFDEDRSRVYVNLRNLSRLYAIDYPSGEVAWVMGEGGDFGQGLWAHPHDPHFLAENRLLVFDNGFQRPGGDPYNPYSRVIEVQFDPDAKTAAIVWEYRPTPDFFSVQLGSARPLGDGHVLVDDGMNGRLVEVTREGKKAWELKFQGVARIYKAQPIARAFFEDW